MFDKSDKAHIRRLVIAEGKRLAALGYTVELPKVGDECVYCPRAEWYELYDHYVYCCDLSHCFKDDDFDL